ncbi:tubulin-like doman-containing protein [Rossellomorea marisflavi]|uniref:tubulin-like doman-containing protein n=1 Tax=Rossellomorea marisflavi TaxID=189381 RepID=UPI0025B04024|nr:tubulin-like doman-containing protein [Rossellomorea marisflavi]WJV20714.1 tubulin-like doman-containing protein [Rossellomorea marisflavi]
MRVGLIGIGQAGASVVDKFAEEGYETLAINYSLSDLNSCTHIQNKHLLIGSEGVGKDRSLATSLMQMNWEKTVEVVKEQFSQTSTKLIFVVFSTGGGTGSGVASIFLDLLNSELEDKVVVAVPILPHKSESAISHMNTLECIRELSEVDVCILPIDNNKSSSVNKLSLYKEVNESFFTTLNQIITQTSLTSPYSNLDQTDLIKLFSTVGWSSIAQLNLANMNGQVNLSEESIVDQISSSNGIFMSVNESKIIRLGLTFYGQESLMNLVNTSSILNKFSNHPLDIFEGWYPNLSQGYLRLIYTGLSFDTERLGKIEGKTISDSETLENVLNQSHKVNVKSQVNLNKPNKQRKALSSILEKYKK